jgi:hypothetical protein
VSDPVTYTAVLPVDEDTVQFVSALLAADRRRRRIRPKRRALGCYRQAVLVLRWFLDGTRLAQLAADKWRISEQRRLVTLGERMLRCLNRMWPHFGMPTRRSGAVILMLPAGSWLRMLIGSSTARACHIAELGMAPRVW